MTLCLCTGLFAAGCSAAAGQDPIREAVQRFDALAASGDTAAACALLAPLALDDLGGERDCPRALREVSLSPAPVTTVSNWDDEAQVKTSADTVFLHEFPAGWLITGAACRPRNEQVYQCEVGGP